MPELFVFRSQAALSAQRAGHHNFRTMTHEDTGMWKWAYEPGESLAEGWQMKDYVHHVETDWDRRGPRPVKVGVLVVTCRIDEIPLDDLALSTTLGFSIEPLTPSLWHRGDATGAATKSAGSTSPRARSDVESPVKVVWRLADEMVDATRQEVIAACVAAGVNKATASTQYYRWQKAKSA